MTHELSFVITNRIADSARETYGKALADAIDEKFKPFYELRNVLNNSVTAMSNLFIGLVKERAKKDKVPITNELLKELMEKTVAEGGLKEFVPNLMTAHSKTLEEGFIALKKYSKRSGDIKTKVQVNYSGKPIQNNWLDGRKTKTDSHTGGIKEVSLENAGVGTMIGLIHSFDGAQMQTIISELEAFGVHDAWLINALEAEKAGGRLNEVFRKQNEEYSIAEVIENRFNEIQKLVASTTTGLISPELLAAFKEDAAKANTPKGFGGTQPIGFEKAMKDIKAARIRWFNEIKHWAQFVFENSSFPGKTMEATSAAVEPVVETLVAELPVEPTVVSIQTTVTDPVSQETRSKIDSIIDPILAKVTAVQRDEFKSFLNELYRSVNPNAGDLKIGITDSKAKAGKQYYFDSETNTVYVPDNMKQLVGLVHELLHAATFFGVYQGLAEGNRDIVDFKNFLASHKDAILAKLKGKKNKEANQIRYIYEVPADQRKENMADYAERSIVEALVVLGSNTSIRAEWVQLLKEVDPSTAKKVDGLFGQLYEYISKLADEFFLLLMRRDKDEKTPVEQTKALELYYRALAASMKLNPTAPTTITPQKVYQKGDSFTFTSGGETATVKAKVVVDFAGTQIIIHENIEGHTPKYRATEQSTGSYINLDPNIKTIKGIVEALNNRLADIGEQKMKEVIAKFHANKTTASSISLDEQSVLDNLSPKEIADTIESLICRGAK
jgi:hypothetical protein